MSYFNSAIGPYPYKQYSVIQAGDGGMEYGMCTLITGNRKYGSLVGVTAHEMAHAWFQFILATNETKHEWMDEGFTSYISDEAMNEVMNEENPIHMQDLIAVMYTWLKAEKNIHSPLTPTDIRRIVPME